MVQILDRIQREPSTKERFAQAFSNVGQQAPNVAQHFLAKQQNQQENQGLQRLLGQDVSGLGPDIKKEFVKSMLSGRQNKAAEKQQMVETGIGTINRMRQLLDSLGPSNFLSSLGGGETTKNRSEFQQLGKSLIPLVSAGVSIRNQKEFDEYKKILTNANARQSSIEGALNGLQNLLERQLHEAPGERNEERSERLESLEKKETGYFKSHKPSSNLVKVRAPSGELLLIPKNQVNAAMKAGGKVER